MEPSHHTSPLEEAISHGSQRVAQLASLAGAMTQVVLYRRALRQARTISNDERAAQALIQQEQLLRQQARLSWAPAHDDRWLADARVIDAARAWAGAASHADVDPAAAAAMRKCEDRLRTLHPHAMARYDRLRSDGASPLDAMREAAPLFARSPDVRVGDPATIHPALGATADPDTAAPAARVPQGRLALEAGPRSEPGATKRQMHGADRAEQRGMQIVARLRSAAQAAGRPSPGDADLALILDTATNLPHELIDKIIRQTTAELGAEPHRSVSSTRSLPEAGRAAGRQAASDPSVAQLAARNFPHSIAETVRAVSTAQTSRSGALSTDRSAIRLPGPSA